MAEIRIQSATIKPPSTLELGIVVVDGAEIIRNKMLTFSMDQLVGKGPMDILTMIRAALLTDLLSPTEELVKTLVGRSIPL